MQPTQKKGWSKHHDSNYDHDYFVDESGRATWTSHDAELARQASSESAASTQADEEQPRPSSAVLTLGSNPMQKASQRSLHSPMHPATDSDDHSSSIELRVKMQDDGGGRPLSGDYEEAILEASSHRACCSPRQKK